MPKKYFAEKGNKRSGGGPFHMKSYGQGKNPIMMYGKSPVKDLDRFMAGLKGAVEGAGSNVGMTFPGKIHSKKDRYPGVDMIQGWKWRTSEYDKKKAEERRKKEKGS